MPKTDDSTLDLDALERKDPPKPFHVTLGGQQYELIDPQAAPWQDLMDTSSLSAIIRLTVEEDRRDEFTAALQKLPAWKVEQLSKAYTEHFKLTSSPEAPASPTS